MQSTTRYRKQGTNKKAAKSEHPAPQRQRSGAKGGRAAKKTAKLRRVVHNELRDEAPQQQEEITLENYRSDVSIQAPNPTHDQTMSPVTPTLNIPPDAFDLANVGGCIDVPEDSPLFYTDSEAGEDTFFSDFSFSGVHEPESSFNHFVGL